MALTDKLSAIADAIRAKTGKDTLLTLAEMPAEIEGIQAGGDNGAITAYIDGTLETFENADVVEVRPSGFREASALKYVSLPNCTVLKDGAFTSSAIEGVNLPKCKSMGMRVFQGCSKLKNIVLPSLTSMSTYEFYGCSSLVSADLGNAGSIANLVFQYCTVLNTLILRRNTLVSLNTTAVFNNSPFASGGSGGVVYVPSALIAEYQAATNWSTLYAEGTCVFAAIEGSEYE